MLKAHSLASEILSVSFFPKKKFSYWCSVLQLFQAYVDGFPYSGLVIPPDFCKTEGGMFSYFLFDYFFYTLCFKPNMKFKSSSCKWYIQFVVLLLLLLLLLFIESYRATIRE